MTDYKPGTRIRLIRMDDVQTPPCNTLGTVCGIDDIGNILIVWDNGSGLSVIPGVDEFEIVEEGER